jgi:putative ABC transport system permease protein
MHKHILRRLLHSPVFTATTLLTLAIGIGANTAIFSVINSILLKPLPFHEPERLVGLWHTASGLDLKELEMCPSLYFTYREQAHSFTDIGMYNGGTVSMSRIEKPEEVPGLWVTDGVLPILGVQPLIGHQFTQRDTTDGSPATMMLTYGYWQERFGGSTTVLGRHIMADGQDREIIAVLPRSFRFMDPQPAVVGPLQFNRSKIFLGNFSYRGVARLKPGVTLSQANADIGRLASVWLRSWPPPPGFSAKLFENARLGPNVRPLMRDVVGDIGAMLWVIMGTLGLVLLIACANVANLLLVRAEGRQHELSIRAALGAGWGRMSRDLLGESLALGLLGGGLGLALAYCALRVLAAIGPTNVPRLGEIGIDAQALVFTLAIAVGSGLLFGLLPVWKYSGIRPGTGLRDSNRSVSAGKERLQARNVLAVFQIALALVLLICSGLMIRSFNALRHVQPGFTNPGEVMTVRVFVPDTQVKKDEQAIRTHQAILGRLKQIAGVEEASFTNSVTMEGRDSNDVLEAEGHAVAAGKVPPIRRFKFVAPGYFHTMGRRFAAGRDLEWNDLYGYRMVAIISENFAREYWGSPMAALGKRVREGMKDDWREIIGVVEDEFDNGPQEKAPKIVYWPVLMKNFWGNEFFSQRSLRYVVRTRRAGSGALLNEMQSAIWSIVPDSPLAEPQTLKQIYDRSMARTSFTLVMLGIAGAMALLLGLVGIYGVISYSVSQRTKEIGIRMALGARRGQVSGMFVRHGLLLAAVGVLVGGVAALGLTRLLASLLFGVTANDPLTYLLTAVALTGAAILASFLPSLRAMAVDPVDALRSE